MKKKLPRRLYSPLFLIIAVIIGWFGRYYYVHMLNAHIPVLSDAIRADSPEYIYINPYLYTNDNNKKYADLDPLSTSINTYITSLHQTDPAHISNISVYYRDLNSGHWMGINQDEKYQPASLMKVIIMLAVLKHATVDPTLLQQKIYYSAASTSYQYYLPTQTLTAGYYNADQLLKAMIVYSDNNAEESLLQQYQSDVNNLIKTFQLPPLPTNPNDYQTSNFMSAEDYSTLFRALYNGTYLPWDLSEQALDLLTTITFTDGIVSGVPSGTAVAHKFGERTNQFSDGTASNRELHDCGIIYYSNDPYLLCVMTKGSATFPELAETISHISQLVYTYVQSKQ